jgi:hypothetical protein
MRRIITGAVAALALSLVLATSALAFDCTNASKSSPSAGVQVVININTGAIVWVTQGLQKRIDQGLVDPDTGAGFHGLIGLDFDGDGIVDVSTWAGVGPEGTEIPDNAQENGPACRGLTSVFVYLTTCVEA